MNKIPEIELIFNEIINGSFQGTNKVNQMIILDRIKRIEKKILNIDRQLVDQ
jgi:hypothetical protein